MSFGKRNIMQYENSLSNFQLVVLFFKLKVLQNMQNNNNRIIFKIML
jgi:hypothetical protein